MAQDGSVVTVSVVVVAVVAVVAALYAGRVFLIPIALAVLFATVLRPALRRLKLNAVMVLVSVLFWWAIWGVPGAFMAVPMLASTKIICDHVKPLQPIGTFLGA